MKKTIGIFLFSVLCCLQMAVAQPGWEISANKKSNYVPTCVAKPDVGCGARCGGA